MTPFEVLPLVYDFHFPERHIVPVLFAQVNPVRAIFLVVPGMIIVAVPIVIAPVMMIVGLYRHWGDKGSAGE
jgi:hypothetical protein